MTLWETRDLLVLRAVAETDDPEVRGGFLFLGQGVGANKLGVGLSDDDIEIALLTLSDAGYVTATDTRRHGGGGGSFTQLHVTGRGMQALGKWPWFTELSPVSLAALLDQFAVEAATTEETENARRAARYLRTLPPAIVRQVLTTVTVEGAKAALRLGSGG